MYHAIHISFLKVFYTQSDRKTLRCTVRTHNRLQAKFLDFSTNMHMYLLFVLILYMYFLSYLLLFFVLYYLLYLYLTFTHFKSKIK